MTDLKYPKEFVERLAEFGYRPAPGQFATEESQRAAIAWLESLQSAGAEYFGGFTKRGTPLTLVVNLPGRTAVWNKRHGGKHARHS